MSRSTSIADPGIDSKEIAVREWVRHRLGSVAHEDRVARVAEMLFELTRRWHKLARSHGESVQTYQIGDMMHREAADIPPGRILDLPLSRLNSLRRVQCRTSR